MRKLILAVVFAFVPNVSFAQGQWIADFRTSCKVWNPNPSRNETIEYSGPCVNGFAHGRGVVQWYVDGKADGREESEFSDGKRKGRFIATTSNYRVEGEYDDATGLGRGRYVYTNGNRYDGGFSARAERHGRGVYTWSNGSRYEGEFRDNKPNGYGTLTHGGEAYTGSWSNGCFKQGDRRVAAFATNKECGFTDWAEQRQE